MFRRCYSSKLQEIRSTYWGCVVCDEWHLSSNFKSWMERQDWNGNELDKDILFQGNKVYSPEACVFVSSVVNTFMLDCAASQGQWPVGVHWNKANKKFKAYCSNPFTKEREYLGLFTCPQEAHKAWLKCKLKLAKLLAAEQNDTRVAKALVERYENYPECKQISQY